MTKEELEEKTQRLLAIDSMVVPSLLPLEIH